MKKKILSAPEKGFSMLELMIAIVLIAVVASFAFLSISSAQLYAADKQALIIVDMLQEARQKALTQGKVLRVELNDTKKQIRLIDENGTTAAGDDIVLQARVFDPATTVGVKPANVSAPGGVLPKSNSPIPEIRYVQTTYPSSANDKVQTLRFVKTGEVVDAGTDNLGTGAITSGVTIYVYNGASGSHSSVVRAITVSGITAAAQILKCQTNKQGVCTAWVS